MEEKENKNRKMPQLKLPQLKEYRSRREWEEACWSMIVRAPELLDRIITPHEKRDIALRTLAIERLQMGMSYRKIGDALWLSPQTISTIKKGVHENNYRSYKERSKTERKKKVYSPDPYQNPDIKMGAPHKTKYGKVYY